MFHFENPIFFLLIPPVTALFFLLRRLRRYNAVFVSNINPIKKSATRYSHTKIILFILNIAVILFLISIAAGPRGVGGIKEEKLTGIDIVIAMDISGSMRAEDFKPNRIEAAKRITIDFIEKMKGNRIGMVLFAGRSFTQAPLTVDYGILKEFISRIDLSMIDISGTAIGDAIVTGVNRLFDNKARSKVIVLLTDGENNGGSIDPLTAAAVARHRDVKVYTIGIGTSEGAPIPVYSESGRVVGRILVKIDEKQLRDIAEITGGKYIMASDEKGLINAFNQIAAMEKDAIEIKRYTIYKEYYPHLAVIAVFIFSSSFFYERIKRGIRRNQIIKDIFAVSLILLLLFIAVSQKAGGRDADGEGMDIVIAIDASLSMLAEDVSPNRAGYADSLAKRIITSLPDTRIGIVLFSDYGYVLCPLTFDLDSALTLLSNRSADNNSGGTDIADAMTTASLLFTDEKREKIILMLTDGENNRGSRPEKAAEELKDKDIKVYTIGIGKKEGVFIPVKKDGHAGFKKDISGEHVRTRLDDSMLKEISRISSGKYIDIDSDPVEAIKKEGRIQKAEFRRQGSVGYLSFIALMLFMVMSII